MDFSCSQRRKGKGRQKLNIVKIEKESNLQVTFSKRRAGLFKKANELATLCGAEAALVVFSPGNKAFSFGHPSIDAVANKFLNNGVDSRTVFEECHKAERMQGYISEQDQLEGQLKIEQHHADELGQSKKKHMPSIEKLDHHQLCQLQGALLRFKNELDGKMQAALKNDFCPTIPYTCQEHE